MILNYLYANFHLSFFESHYSHFALTFNFRYHYCFYSYFYLLSQALSKYLIVFEEIDRHNIDFECCQQDLFDHHNFTEMEMGAIS
jgi:hypothetical protein